MRGEVAVSFLSENPSLLKEVVVFISELQNETDQAGSGIISGLGGGIVPPPRGMRKIVVAGDGVCPGMPVEVHP